MKEETPFISERLLKLLRCPMTGVELELEGDSLVNEKFGVSYPIVDGIPIMLASPKRRARKSKRKQGSGVDSR
ncbi:MAG: Trm112 family protein [Alphaproteobacteria bacterium]|nr:Trm112 family protein [Alphaproteobacteria bacterium]